MTTVQQAASNPFALMMNPEAVFEAMARSERLALLHSRVCRPLDKPLPVRAAEGAKDLDDAVEGVDEADDSGLV